MVCVCVCVCSHLIKRLGADMSVYLSPTLHEFSLSNHLSELIHLLSTSTCVPCMLFVKRKRKGKKMR